MLNHHNLKDLAIKAYDNEREAKDNAEPGYYALLDVDCMKWFNYNQDKGYQVDEDTIIEQYENAKMRYENLGMLNTAQLSIKEKIEQTKEYRRAYRDLTKLEKIVYQNG